MLPRGSHEVESPKPSALASEMTSEVDAALKSPEHAHQPVLWTVRKLKHRLRCFRQELERKAAGGATAGLSVQKEASQSNVDAALLEDLHKLKRRLRHIERKSIAQSSPSVLSGRDCVGEKRPTLGLQRSPTYERLLSKVQSSKTKKTIEASPKDLLSSSRPNVAVQSDRVRTTVRCYSHYAMFRSCRLTIDKCERKAKGS